MEEIILNIALWFGLYAIVSLSLNIEYGYAGIPNFGRSLAVLMGAFAVGGIVNRLLMLFFRLVLVLLRKQLESSLQLSMS